MRIRISKLDKFKEKFSEKPKKIIPISIPRKPTNKYPHIVYVALKHYKRTWFKNKKPEKEGKMLDEWVEMESILKKKVKED